jgi:hypothetical protein
MVLARDLHHCWVSGCERPGIIADHITPVYPGMGDGEFYDPANLRASCRYHNTARGVAASLERDVARVVAAKASRFSIGLRDGQRPLANTPPRNRYPSLTGDYTRRTPMSAHAR